MSQRTDRVDELLRQEIGVLLAKEIADPRIGFVTITDVETTPDLRHAKVWVSVIGGKADQKETLRALQRSMGFIRHELGRTLRIKRIPDLHVHLDDTAERGTRVLRLLDDIEEGKSPDTIEPYHETLPTPVQRLPHEGDAGEDDESFGAAAAAWADAGGDAAKAARRPSTRRGPGGSRAGRGTPPKTPRRAPKRR
jgi:ribosome-binding factor A